MKLKEHGLAYMALVVQDLDRSFRFYTDILGFELIKEVVVDDEKVAKGGFSNQGFEFKTVAKAPYAIKLVKTKKEPTPIYGAVDDFYGVRYIGIGVVDFDATVAELAAAGVEFLSDVLPAEPVNNVPPMVFFRDPDGNLIEIAGG